MVDMSKGFCISDSAAREQMNAETKTRTRVFCLPLLYIHSANPLMKPVRYFYSFFVQFSFSPLTIDSLAGAFGAQRNQCPRIVCKRFRTHFS